MKKIFGSKLVMLIVGMILAASLIISVGCNSQQIARQYGGNSAVDLPQGQKLVLIAWKEDNLWYLTKPMTDNDVPEIYSFKESSGYGMMEGQVTIKEHK